MLLHLLKGHIDRAAPEWAIKCHYVVSKVGRRRLEFVWLLQDCVVDTIFQTVLAEVRVAKVRVGAGSAREVIAYRALAGL